MVGSIALGTTDALAQEMENSTVGGAPIMADIDIVDNAVNSSIHMAPIAAVQAAGLLETLKSEEPFTVFPPTDDAFAALPAGTVDILLVDENRDQLVKVLTAHVVPGRLTSEDLLGMAGGGTANLTTVSGEALPIGQRGRTPVVHDESGDVYAISIPNVMQSSAVIHMVDGVLLPR